MSSESIPVRFHVGDAVYTADVNPNQIIHEAFDHALPEEIRTNHRLVLRAPNGDELFADVFVRDVVAAYGQADIVVRATPIAKPAGPPRSFTNFGFDHLAIAVADRAAACRFFSEGLGLTVVRDDEHQTVVTSGHTAIFMFDARPGIPLSEPDPSKIHHIGFVVDDLEAALWHLRTVAEGLSSDFTLLERDERWSLYLHYRNGPVRLMIQLSEIKPGARGFADPHRFADHLYDYARGPYGGQITPSS